MIPKPNFSTPINPIVFDPNGHYNYAQPVYYPFATAPNGHTQPAYYLVHPNQPMQQMIRIIPLPSHQVPTFQQSNPIPTFSIQSHHPVRPIPVPINIPMPPGVSPNFRMPPILPIQLRRPMGFNHSVRNIAYVPHPAPPPARPPVRPSVQTPARPPAQLPVQPPEQPQAQPPLESSMPFFNGIFNWTPPQNSPAFDINLLKSLDREGTEALQYQNYPCADHHFTQAIDGYIFNHIIPTAPLLAKAATVKLHLNEIVAANNLMNQALTQYANTVTPEVLSIAVKIKVKNKNFEHANLLAYQAYRLFPGIAPIDIVIQAAKTNLLLKKADGAVQLLTKELNKYRAQEMTLPKELLAMVGKIKLKCNQRADAEQFLGDAVLIYGNEAPPDLLMKMGYIHFLKENFPEADKYFERALSHPEWTPKVDDIAIAAQIKSRLGDFKNATIYFKKAMNKFGNNVHPLFLKLAARNSFLEEDYSETEKILAKIFDQHSRYNLKIPSSIFLMAGFTQFNLDNFQEAHSLCSSALVAQQMGMPPLSTRIQGLIREIARIARIEQEQTFNQSSNPTSWNAQLVNNNNIRNEIKHFFSNGE